MSSIVGWILFDDRATEKIISRLCVQAGWEDVPHLSEEAKKQLIDAMEPHTREARTKGVPVLGAGLIYPVPESTYVVEPFELPEFWPRAYGLDVGWNRTAAIWGAWDRQTDCVYVYSEHYQGQSPPSVHADAIKARGWWIPGAIDPASAGSSQVDGKRLRDVYNELGLNLHDADNSVEAGIHACYQRLSSGRLKIFRTCRNLITEMRIYRRDENGKVVKENDHCCDAKRYLIMTGMMYARISPDFDDEPERPVSRNSVTGY